MKSLRIKAIILVSACMLALAPVHLGLGQSEAQSAESLKIEHLQKAKRSVVVPQGKFLKVRTLDGEKFKGELASVSDSSLVVGNQEILFQKVKKVTVRGHGRLGAKITGWIMGIVGLLGFALGAFLALIGVSTDTSQTGCAGAIFAAVMIVFGVLLGLVGLVFLVIGIVGILLGYVGGKAFKPGIKWALRKGR